MLWASQAGEAGKDLLDELSKTEGSGPDPSPNEEEANITLVNMDWLASNTQWRKGWMFMKNTREVSFNEVSNSQKEYRDLVYWMCRSWTVYPYVGCAVGMCADT